MDNKRDDIAIDTIQFILNLILFLIFMPIVIVTMFTKDTKPRKKGYKKWKA
jgi:hypothetical protein